MIEIARCPRCGEVPVRIQHSAGGFGFRCCGAEMTCKTYWNQYAAAMELANATTWEKESLEAFSGRLNKESSSVAVSAILLCKKATLRVHEVFND